MKRLIAFMAMFLVVSQAHSIESTSVVEGVVLDAKTNMPMDDVVVSFFSDAPVLAGVTRSVLYGGTTDAQGHFSISHVAPGRYRVVPERNGFVFAPRPGMKAAREPGVWVQVPAGRPVRDIQLNMVKGAVIIGHVLDDKGQAAPGNVASVSLMRYRYSDSGKRTLGLVPGVQFPGSAGSFVRMDDRGEYRFYGLPSGDYYVQVSGGPRSGTPAKLSVPVFYPGTEDEALAASIHVDSGDEVHLDTMTFHQVDASQVYLKFDDVGSPRGERRIYLGNSMIASTSLQPITVPLRPGHYEGLVTTPTTFGRIDLDLGSGDIEKVVVMQPGIHVKVQVSLEDEAGKRSPYSPGFTEFSCRLRSETRNITPSCVGVPRDGGYYMGFSSIGTSEPYAIPPDSYHLEFSRLPVDTYVIAATVSGQAVRGVIPVDHDIQIDIVLSASGAVLRGGVRDSAGEKLPDAVVVLVPQDPSQGIGDLYHSSISDTNGDYELRSIAPGSYHLYAWPELEGAAYRNAEFMKKYEERGVAVKIEKGGQFSQDLSVLSE